MSIEYSGKPLKRAIRRHHKRRMIRHAKRILHFEMMSTDQQEIMARKFADCIKMCSCELGCGNIRRNGWYGIEARLTKQERIADLKLQEQVHESQQTDEWFLAEKCLSM